MSTDNNDLQESSKADDGQCTPERYKEGIFIAIEAMKEAGWTHEERVAFLKRAEKQL